MHIKINKDFEKAYKDELFRGFSTKEVLSLVAGVAIGGGVTYLLYKQFGVPVATGVYAGVFCAIPVLLPGFLTIQGMSPWKYLQEIIYTHKTAQLSYVAGEMPGKRQQKTFKMDAARPDKKKRRGKGEKKNKKTGRGCME